MKQTTIGRILLVVGIILFIIPVLIVFYQQDIIIGLLMTGAFLIIGSVIVLVNYGDKNYNNSTRTN